MKSPSDGALVVSLSSGLVSCLPALTHRSAVGSSSEKPSCRAKSASASGELEHLQCHGVDCQPALAPRPEGGGSSWPGPQPLWQSWGGLSWVLEEHACPWCPVSMTLGALTGTVAETPVWLFVSAPRCPGWTQLARLRVDGGGGVTSALPPLFHGPGDACLCPAGGPQREARSLGFGGAETRSELAV